MYKNTSRFNTRFKANTGENASNVTRRRESASQIVVVPANPSEQVQREKERIIKKLKEFDRAQVKRKASFDKRREKARAKRARRLNRSL